MTDPWRGQYFWRQYVQAVADAQRAWAAYRRFIAEGRRIPAGTPSVEHALWAHKRAVADATMYGLGAVVEHLRRLERQGDRPAGSAEAKGGTGRRPIRVIAWRDAGDHPPRRPGRSQSRAAPPARSRIAYRVHVVRRSRP